MTSAEFTHYKRCGCGRQLRITKALRAQCCGLVYVSTGAQVFAMVRSGREPPPPTRDPGPGVLVWS